MRLIPAITGLGLVTPLGNSVAATWDALCAGQMIGDVGRVNGVEVAGEPRINSLARLAARQAIGHAGWTDDQINQSALVVGTSKGPVDAWLDQCGGVAPAGEFGLSATAFTLARDLRVGGSRRTVSGACASGLLALIDASQMIADGQVERVIVVSAESSLHPLFQASFARLGVIAPPGHGCRPFDQTRAGFVLSESAAAVTLEISCHGSTSQTNAIVDIDTFAMGADASHLTHGDPDGTTLRAILNRVFAGRGVDLVHAHGTGTLANDPIELSAIENTLASLARPSQSPPNLYSHKGALGHTLGAAGLVAAVLNCMSHLRQVIPPNIQTAHPLPTRGVVLEKHMRLRPVERSLAVAAGFGGAIAAVTLKTSVI